MIIDRTKIEKAVKLFLEAIGENSEREGLIETPRRVANMCAEMFEKNSNVDESALFKSFNVNFDGLVVVKDISFCSFCEHHLMPFFGNVHVAYIPGSRVIGLSKIARIVNLFSGRLQLQERLTNSIASAIFHNLNAKGVMVAVDGFHSCVALRGVKKASSRTLTFISNGVCKNNESYRSEFLKLVGLF